MEELFEIQKLLINQFEKQPFYERTIFERMRSDNAISGIVGPRGIGKTMFLLRRAIEQGAKQGRALYVSADNIYFLKSQLIELVDRLYKETDVRLLLIDEVHKYAEWNQALKNISDTYLEMRILFSGSSTIDLIHSQYDLSRRVTLYPLCGLSFREYLEFYHDLSFPCVDLERLIKEHLTISHEIECSSILKYFKRYLQIGYYPFFRRLQEDTEKFQAIENATQKTIYEDIATLHSLKTRTLLTVEKLFKYVVSTLPGEFSVYKLSNTLGKDFESVAEYLRVLAQAGLVRFLYPKKAGKAFLRNPIKCYPDNANLIYASYVAQTTDNMLGKVRENFVLNQLQNAGHTVYYSEQGDFQVGDIVFEVGGKNKTEKQIAGQKKAFILADGILTGSPKKIPLYLMGLLY